jgi:hypothetical protein
MKRHIETAIRHDLRGFTEEEARGFVAYESSFMGPLTEVTNPHVAVADIEWHGTQEVPGYNGLPVIRTIVVRWWR